MRPENQDAESKELAKSSAKELAGEKLKPRVDDPALGSFSNNEVAAAPVFSVGLPVAPEPRLPKIIPFDTLARCGEEIWIENNGQIYRLRKTKQGKLILTK